MAHECGQVLREFFAERRALYKQRRAAPEPEAPPPAADDSDDTIPTGDAVEVDSFIPPP
ncbi:hypothetical protein D3C72_2491270 [compost metagenome]